ncbi:hypothetical protein [Roseinatronobacter bogoriensis]|uniref:Uncharacterized protein n=1 Tax=Roseinatronobacter bogoriensis subsp. barguzinensis TaxID=441209 RepID=A0A2K8K704_9RHOB|nr:hypothetical protein [Rhodobaca]ATX65231.1 hypothetical protein BG454_04810 [Rhodobaca barguzinensis]MBB4209331.1 hypothetical protein [Rhodobaca bogoriensis DSM 18756]TDW34335.1 hypothetical protein LY39_03390 [Rhodobaca barguzinensis]TDY67074.1 hypothetical protein EV660_10875 [Rhodobaca bogoriensis DSM 18756]
MPEMISTGNKAIINRELVARGVSPAQIAWAIAELDQAACDFVQDMRTVRPKRRSGKTLKKQVEKIAGSTGEARAANIRDAVEMGLDPEALELFVNAKPTHTLHEAIYRLEVLDRLDVEWVPKPANSAFPQARRFMLNCIGIWIVTDGEIRFSTNARQDGGPLGRFLRAAKTDAYLKAAENNATREGAKKIRPKLPSAEGLRKSAQRLYQECEWLGLEWDSLFDKRVPYPADPEDHT